MADTTESDPPLQGGPTAGTLLSAERKRQGLSLSDVARQLKLSPRQIEALERDDFALFRGTLFVHGFLRNYSRLLKIDSAPLIKAADAVLNPPPPVVQERQEAATPIARAQRLGGGQQQEVQTSGTVAVADANETARYPSRMVILGVVALAVVVVGYALRQRDVRPASPSETRAARNLENNERAEVGAKPQAKSGAAQREDPNAQRQKEQKIAQVRPTQPAPVPTPSVQDAARSTTSPNVPGAQLPEMVTETELSELSAGRAVPVAAEADTLTLQMMFEQESWVEIKDANGKTIFAQLNAAGSKRSLTGNSPLSVVVGNANGVHISINDRVISLEPHTQFNVARVTLP